MTDGIWNLKKSSFQNYKSYSCLSNQFPCSTEFKPRELNFWNQWETYMNELVKYLMHKNDVERNEVSARHYRMKLKTRMTL